MSSVSQNLTDRQDTKLNHRWPKASALLLVACVACEEHSTVPPQNRHPIIESLTAYPTAIGIGDSTIVVCDAQDADGDSLVYDWITDCRLIIKGNTPDDHELFGSRTNYHVFYHGCVIPFDSAWVECDVRDRKGGVAVRQVHILVNQ